MPATGRGAPTGRMQGLLIRCPGIVSTGCTTTWALLQRTRRASIARWLRPAWRSSGHDSKAFSAPDADALVPFQRQAALKLIRSREAWRRHGDSPLPRRSSWATRVVRGQSPPGDCPLGSARSARDGKRALVRPQEVAGDHDSLDLARALVDLGDLRVAVVPLGRELARVAVAAEHLDRVLARLDGDPRREQLRHRSLSPVGLP